MSEQSNSKVEQKYGKKLMGHRDQPMLQQPNSKIIYTRPSLSINSTKISFFYKFMLICAVLI